MGDNSMLAGDILLMTSSNGLQRPVTMEHSSIAANSIVLGPGCSLMEGSLVGDLTQGKPQAKFSAWTIWTGELLVLGAWGCIWLNVGCYRKAW